MHTYLNHTLAIRSSANKLIHSCLITKEEMPMDSSSVANSSRLLSRKSKESIQCIHNLSLTLNGGVLACYIIPYMYIINKFTFGQAGQILPGSIFSATKERCLRSCLKNLMTIKSVLNKQPSHNACNNLYSSKESIREEYIFLLCMVYEVNDSYSYPRT